tara:strand:- start:22 stop:228 length:207 start_codon:yes stop_codon:yes gene_type:complete
MPEYTCTVKLEFSGNNHEAKSKKKYIELVKEQYFLMHHISLDESEIIDIFYSSNKKPNGKVLAKKQNN